LSHVGDRYALPAEIDQYVDQGFLEVLTKRPNRMTVESHIPPMRIVDHRRRMTAYSIVWIHPAHNAAFCDYYDETPGDLPNFYVEVVNTNGPSEIIDDVQMVDDLAAWLEGFQSVGVSL
jgi:hypothetical protein